MLSQSYTCPTPLPPWGSQEGDCTGTTWEFRNSLVDHVHWLPSHTGSRSDYQVVNEEPSVSMRPSTIASALASSTKCREPEWEPPGWAQQARYDLGERQALSGPSVEVGSNNSCLSAMVVAVKLEINFLERWEALRAFRSQLTADCSPTPTKMEEPSHDSLRLTCDTRPASVLECGNRPNHRGRSEESQNDSPELIAFVRPLEECLHTEMA